MKYTKKLSISRTTGEWKEIQRQISARGKNNLRDYILKEAARITEEYNKCPQSITVAKGNKKEKRPTIHVNIYADLEKIAIVMDIPVSAVVDRLIIQPLLRN